jgi:hypothetical protein
MRGTRPKPDFRKKPASITTTDRVGTPLVRYFEVAAISLPPAISQNDAFDIKAIVAILQKYDYNCSIEFPVPEDPAGAWDTATGRFNASPVSKTPPWIHGIPKSRSTMRFF